MVQGNGAASVTPQREKLPRSRMWIPHVAWAGLIVIPLVFWMAVLSQSELPPGQCSGIGWGCSLAGWDAVAFALIIIGVPLLFVLLIGHLIIGFAQWLRSRRHQSSPSR